jgi:hypothetical protein
VSKTPTVNLLPVSLAWWYTAPGVANIVANFREKIEMALRELSEAKGKMLPSKNLKSKIS